MTKKEKIDLEVMIIIIGMIAVIITLIFQSYVKIKQVQYYNAVRNAVQENTIKVER